MELCIICFTETTAAASRNYLFDYNFTALCDEVFQDNAATLPFIETAASVENLNVCHACLALISIFLKERKDLNNLESKITELEQQIVSSHHALKRLRNKYYGAFQKLANLVSVGNCDALKKYVSPEGILQELSSRQYSVEEKAKITFVTFFREQILHGAKNVKMYNAELTKLLLKIEKLQLKTISSNYRALDLEKIATYDSASNISSDNLTGDIEEIQQTDKANASTSKNGKKLRKEKSCNVDSRMCNTENATHFKVTRFVKNSDWDDDTNDTKINILEEKLEVDSEHNDNSEDYSEADSFSDNESEDDSGSEIVPRNKPNTYENTSDVTEENLIIHTRDSDNDNQSISLFTIGDELITENSIRVSCDDHETLPAHSTHRSNPDLMADKDLLPRIRAITDDPILSTNSECGVGKGSRNQNKDRVSINSSNGRQATDTSVRLADKPNGIYSNDEQDHLPDAKGTYQKPFCRLIFTRNCLSKEESESDEQESNTSKVLKQENDDVWNPENDEYRTPEATVVETKSILKGMSAFRRNIIRRILIKNKVYRTRMQNRLLKSNKDATTSISENAGWLTRNPYEEYPFQYDPVKDLLHVRDIEVFINDKLKRLKCSKCQHVVTLPAQKRWAERNQTIETTVWNHIMKQHFDVFKCPTCASKLGSLAKLREHMKGHQNKFVCEICKRPLLSQVSLKAHMWTHKSKAETEWLLSERVKEPATVKFRRLQKNDLARRHPCPTCEKRFRTSSALTEHRRIHNQNRERIMCSKCGGMFLQRSYKVHQKYCGITATRFKCNSCEKSFKTDRLRKLHHKTHTTVRPFLCSLCPKSFKLKDLLRTHQRTHTNERPYICTKGCRGCFKTNRNRRRHENSCNGQGTPIRKKAKRVVCSSSSDESEEEMTVNETSTRTLRSQKVTSQS